MESGLFFKAVPPPPGHPGLSGWVGTGALPTTPPHPGGGGIVPEWVAQGENLLLAPNVLGNFFWIFFGDNFWAARVPKECPS